MELLPPVGWADVVRQSDLRGESGELRVEVEAQLPRLVAASIASMMGVTGLVLVAEKLA